MKFYKLRSYVVRVKVLIVSYAELFLLIWFVLTSTCTFCINKSFLFLRINWVAIIKSLTWLCGSCFSLFAFVLRLAKTMTCCRLKYKLSKIFLSKIEELQYLLFSNQSSKLQSKLSKHYAPSKSFFERWLRTNCDFKASIFFGWWRIFSSNSTSHAKARKAKLFWSTRYQMRSRPVFWHL